MIFARSQTNSFSPVHEGHSSFPGLGKSTRGCEFVELVLQQVPEVLVEIWRETSDPKEQKCSSLLLGLVGDREDLICFKVSVHKNPPRVVWGGKGPQSSSSSTPALGRDTFHYPNPVQLGLEQFHAWNIHSFLWAVYNIYTHITNTTLYMF